jgi:hypothetical protein
MVRVLAWLLAATAAGTVVVEVLNWAYAPEAGYGLAVRTSWALLRSIGFLVLIWHVRAGRAGARPFGLILAVTTVFAVGRLLVPRSGTPPVLGVIGFVALVVLCAVVVGMLYRSDQVADYLSRPQTRLMLGRGGISRQRLRPRPHVSGWVLTARVSAFTYSPLMLVSALVAIGTIFDGRLVAVPAVLLWIVAALVISFVVAFASIFLVRGKRWARGLLVAATAVVLLVDLPLCWWLLGVDGLIRDGGPLVIAAALAMYGLWRAGRAAPPAGPA